MIGFNAVPGLSTLDYITVAVIEKYLDFKVGKGGSLIVSHFAEGGRKELVLLYMKSGNLPVVSFCGAVAF